MQLKVLLKGTSTLFYTGINSCSNQSIVDDVVVVVVADHNNDARQDNQVDDDDDEIDDDNYNDNAYQHQLPPVHFKRHKTDQPD